MLTSSRILKQHQQIFVSLAFLPCSLHVRLGFPKYLLLKLWVIGACWSQQFLRTTAYMLKCAYAIAVPSDRLSVHPSVTRVIHAKTVEVRIMRFSPCSSPIPLVFARDKFHPEILTGSPWTGASNKGGVVKIRNFHPITRRISETVQDRTKVTINH